MPLKKAVGEAGESAGPTTQDRHLACQAFFSILLELRIHTQ
jgi:hypothetical protein